MTSKVRTGDRGKLSASGRRNKSAKQDVAKEQLAFKVLSQDLSTQYSTMNDVDEIEKEMLKFLKLKNTETDLKEAAILDYYVGLIWWAREKSFTTEQLSAFFTVGNYLFESIKEKHTTLTETLKDFKKYFAGLGMNDTVDLSGGLECFDVDTAKQIIQFFNTTIFKHYKLYEYMFCCTQAEEIIGLDLELETAKPSSMPWPPPLDEGIDQDLYNLYIVPPVEIPLKTELSDAEKSSLKKEEMEKDQNQANREDELFQELGAEKVKKILHETFDQVVAGVEIGIADLLRDKENNFMTRINKIHKIA